MTPADEGIAAARRVVKLAAQDATAESRYLRERIESLEADKTVLESLVDVLKMSLSESQSRVWLLSRQVARRIRQ